MPATVLVFVRVSLGDPERCPGANPMLGKKVFNELRIGGAAGDKPSGENPPGRRQEQVHGHRGGCVFDIFAETVVRLL